MPSPLSIHVQERALRCALCHGEAYGSLTRCTGCGTLGHQECFAGLSRCPTLGCQPMDSGGSSPAVVARPRHQAYRRLPGLQALREVFASDTAHLLFSMVTGLVVLAAYFTPRNDEQPLERGTRQLERACRIYRGLRGRWPRDLDVLVRYRHYGAFPRYTAAGKPYALLEHEGHLLLVWETREGWRLHEVAEVTSAE